MFTARYGLIPYIKQITFNLWDVNSTAPSSVTLEGSISSFRAFMRYCLPYGDVNLGQPWFTSVVPWQMKLVSCYIT